MSGSQVRKRCSAVLGARQMQAAALGAAMLLAGCKKEPTAPTLVAASDLTVPLQANTIQALSGLTFSYPSGAAIAPELTGKAVTLAFTNLTSATPTVTVVSPTEIGTDGQPARFSAPTEFGSCVFTVTASTFAPGRGPQVGQRLTINICTFKLLTANTPATNLVVAVQIVLQLGGSLAALLPSSPIQTTVSINPTTGVVTVNNLVLPTGVGTVTLRPTTGGG